MSQKAMIASIIQWSNGMVSVFNEKGEQMPKFQGRRKDVIEKLRWQNFTKAKFEIGSFGIGVVPMTQEQFFSEAWN